MSKHSEFPAFDTARPCRDEITALTKAVGSRVRAAREASGMSRRALSETSGVSQRYLAQVETGDGNVSIGLLHKVGRALGKPSAWFFGVDGMTDEASRVGALFAAADPDRQRAVREILEPAGKAGRVALVGLRGAGKSTLGRRAAETITVPFCELNDEIRVLSGMPVADVMALYGQEGYRALERKALSRVADHHERVILAVAGGIVSEPETFRFLLERFNTIWLRASPREHMDRVIAQGDTRPMAGNPAAFDDLQSILSRREDQYRQAHATVDTSDREENESAADLVQAIVQFGAAEP